jgi:hypothetical protein
MHEILAVIIYVLYNDRLEKGDIPVTIEVTEEEDKEVPAEPEGKDRSILAALQELFIESSPEVRTISLFENLCLFIFFST